MHKYWYVVATQLAGAIGWTKQLEGGSVTCSNEHYRAACMGLPLWNTPQET
jgi:hypothetical protein